MEIKKVITGVLDENCYVLIKNNTAIIIDPGDDYLDIKEAIFINIFTSKTENIELQSL